MRQRGLLRWVVVSGAKLVTMGRREFRANVKVRVDECLGCQNGAHGFYWQR